MTKYFAKDQILGEVGDEKYFKQQRHVSLDFPNKYLHCVFLALRHFCCNPTVPCSLAGYFSVAFLVNAMDFISDST